MFAMAFSLFALPAANAHDPPWNITTWAFISVEPNPIGVGQEAFVNFWIDKVPPTVSRQYGDRWHNFKVTVTDPSGHEETLGPFTSDTTGGTYTRYTPDEVGKYEFVFSFPGQTLEGDNPPPDGVRNPDWVGDYFEPSTSKVLELIVQEEQIGYNPQTPIPTTYWERPIFSENLDWYKISGNWLGLAAVGFTRATGHYNASGNFNPYTTGPNTAHVLWTKPLAPGGIIGGELGGSQYGSSYYQTPQYEPKFGGIIINGVLYYQELPGSSTYPAGWVAVDMRTGQEIWTKDTTVPLLCGQVLSYVDPNQYGGLAYLWSRETTVAPNTGTTYGMYDATTGNWILNIVNGTGFSRILVDDRGSLLGYYTNNTDHTLNMWNSTKCIQGPDPMGFWRWRPQQGAEIPFEYGIQMTAPLVTEYQGEPIDPNLGILTMSSDIVLLNSRPTGSGQFQVGWELRVGYDAHTGQKLWGPLNHTFTPFSRLKVHPAMQGVVVEFTHPTMTTEAYSLKTGQKLWGPTEPYLNPWGYHVAYDGIAAYGMFYQTDFGGYVHAYNLTTGEQEWLFWTGTSGYETPYGVYTLHHVEVVADGKVYVNGGHTYSPPLYRGANLFCINATTGEEIWRIASFTMSNAADAAIADGILLDPNGYDARLYAYGKGRSATTVTTPETTQPLGTQILIKGTVTDQSPGQTCLGIPAAGTPAIADEYMTPWMEYLYMQQPKPSNATGVEVTLDVIDANNNYRNIGTATSDANGFYSFAWEPDIPGKYTVIATFAGSESYYRSSSETAFNVEEAPAASPEPTPQSASMTDLYFIPSVVGIIIAIAVVGVVLILLLRKR
jgi:hypothetical protein